MTHPYPATWLVWATAEHTIDRKVQERLRNLWHLADTDAQRWELEQLAEAVAASTPAASADDFGLEAAVDYLHEAIGDLQAIARKVDAAAKGRAA
jgi:hypothetical protein